MNRSKDLRNIFREHLKNKRNVCINPYYNANSSYNRCINRHSVNFPNEIKILFYEWSDVSNNPRCFYKLDSFEYFLKTCNIFMESYQRDIIRNLGTVYVSCYTGTKQLSIRSSYTSLANSIKEHDKNRLISQIKPPSLILEAKNNMVANDGSFFG